MKKSKSRSIRQFIVRLYLLVIAEAISIESSTGLPKGEVNKEDRDENAKLDRKEPTSPSTHTNIKMYLIDPHLQGSQKNHQLQGIKRLILAT